MKNKIYGQYPGSIKNIEEIKKLNEVELFFAISSLYNDLLSSKAKDKNIDTVEDEYALEYLMNQTEKFGVELEKSDDGRIIKSGDYASWYEYHLHYFNKKLKRNEFMQFLELKSRGYNVSKYLPNDSYLEYKKKINTSSANVYSKVM
jgi:hypothetical protein